MTAGDPLELFREWFAAAQAAGLELPEAMTLATAGLDGSPPRPKAALHSRRPAGYQSASVPARRTRGLLPSAPIARSRKSFFRPLESNDV